MVEQNIIKTCEKYNITNYTINPDMSIDVDGDVLLYGKDLSELPLKFGKVMGTFQCSTNRLTTLEGCPKHVGGGFYCSYNNLTTLEGCPSYVGDYFYCHYNKLTSLKHCPSYIGGNFGFVHNNFKERIPVIDTYIGITLISKHLWKF